MTSVPFCNLSDAFPGWSVKNTVPDKLKKNIETNYFPEDIRSFQQTLFDQITNKNNDQQVPQQQAQQKPQQQAQRNRTEKLNEELSMSSDAMSKLPTFTDAQKCNERNNEFQNNAANSILRTNINPLGPGIVQQDLYYPYMQKQQYPYNNYLMYPNNILPINQPANLWPQQMWAQSPQPDPRTNDSAFNKAFSYLGLNNVEYFGNLNGMDNDNKNIIIIILMFLFVVQLVDVVLGF